MDDGAHWPEDADIFFIDLCYEEVKQRIGSTQLDKRNWKKIELEMIAKFGQAYRLDKLKQKWHRLRSSTKTFQGLTEANGFEWNTETNTVTADDEVWEAYIKKYPDAKRFKRKKLAHYNKLKDMFAFKSATGPSATRPVEADAVGKTAATARVTEKVPCVSNAGSAPDVEEVGESSGEVREVEKISLEKTTTRKRKSPMSGKILWQEAIESNTENERYSSDRLITLFDEKEARRMSTLANSMTRDELLLKQCVEKLTKHQEFLLCKQYSGFMMELVRSKDLRIAFMAIPDELTLHFLKGLMDD